MIGILGGNHRPDSSNGVAEGSGSDRNCASAATIVREVAQSRQAMRFRMGGVLRPVLSVGLLPIMRTSGAAGRLGLGGLASASATQGLPMGAEVVLTLEAVEAERPTLEQMADRWRLTPAERRLLRALVAGHTVTKSMPGCPVFL